MGSVIKAKSKRNLMLFSGRAHPELAPRSVPASA